MFKDKLVLVTGARGMIGKELVKLLEERGADVFEADLPTWDVTDPGIADFVTEGIDYVFHLAGIKGNPRMTKEKPVDFMEPMLKFDTNMITAAQKNGVKRFLYTSSYAVLNPESDKYPAWAKQTAEKLIEAMRIQYPDGTRYCIVRPANVFGRYDDYTKKECMVVTDLIRKAKFDKGDLEVWGDGSQVRSMISAKDMARAMIKTMENMPEEPIGLAGWIVQIKNVAEIIAKSFNKKIKFDKTKPTGPSKKLINEDLSKIGFEPSSLSDELNEVIEYARNNWHSSL